MNLTAGPKYRAFLKTPSSAAPVSDVQRMAAASHFLGEVSDSPPVCLNGEFTTIGDRKITTPLVNKSPMPMASVEATNPAPEQFYKVKTYSLQDGLARMAALYHSLGGIR